MTTAVKEPATSVPLVLADRCDGPGLSRPYLDRSPQCGAQAFVRVQTNSGELLFCGHHYAGYELAFMSAGYQVDDQRSRINDKPGGTL